MKTSYLYGQNWKLVPKPGIVANILHDYALDNFTVWPKICLLRGWGAQKPHKVFITKNKNSTNYNLSLTSTLSKIHTHKLNRFYFTFPFKKDVPEKGITINSFKQGFKDFYGNLF